MIYRLWGLNVGPEWATSCETADPGYGRFAEMLEAVKDAVGIDPFGYGSKDYLSRDQRTLTAADAVAGYRIVVFFAVDPGPGQSCTLVWVGRETI